MPPFRCALTLNAAVLFACGCAAVAPTSRYAELDLSVPGAWAATSYGAAGVDYHWIIRFRDRVLQNLVDEALQANPDLHTAQARVARAASAVRGSAAPLQPQLDVNFNPSRTKQNFIGFPEEFTGGSTPAFIDNRFGATLDLSWEIDVWGRLRAGLSAASAELQASGADYRAARSSLVAQVAKAWFALAEANQQLALSHDSLESFRATELVLQERFESGESEGGVAAQLRIAKSDSANGRAQVELRGEQRDLALRQLEILLGRYPSATVVESSSLPAVPPTPPAGLPSELLLRRPDLLAAERRFAASGKRLEEARRAFFPRLALTGSAGNVTSDLDQLANSDFGVWTLAGNVVQPILDGGSLLAQRDQRRAEDREALAQLQSVVLQAFLEVETALEADSFLGRRQSALEEAVELAAEADTESRSNYRDGVGDILTVLTAQVRLFSSRANLITVRRQRLDNRVNLHLALGGDYLQRSAQP
ncbi:MAG TPA: efflux transporter outer membrane subunit [Verrucomicrobiales bacterium]|nr:efflux transporter outer membrane subunit [Verrucomicrobiales bacterium]